MIIALQAPFDSAGWDLPLAAESRKRIIQSLLQWRDSRELGEREILIVSPSLERSGLCDIIDTSFVSQSLARVRNEIMEKADTSKMLEKETRRFFGTRKLAVEDPFELSAKEIDFLENQEEDVKNPYRKFYSSELSFKPLPTEEEVDQFEDETSMSNFHLRGMRIPNSARLRRM